jgi:hypothetical protein
MNISLRKASALQNSINEVVKSIALKTEIVINEFQNPEAELALARKAFNADIKRKDALAAALYEIRREVSSANHTAGVDSRLTNIAYADKQIQNYTALAGKDIGENIEVVKGKLDKIRNRKEDTRSIYGPVDTVTVSLLQADDIKEFKALVSMLKKNKQKLQDEVLELNVRTNITLSDKSVQTLTQEGLL